MCYLRWDHEKPNLKEEFLDLQGLYEDVCEIEIEVLFSVCDETYIQRCFSATEKQCQ